MVPAEIPSVPDHVASAPTSHPPPLDDPQVSPEWAASEGEMSDSVPSHAYDPNPSVGPIPNRTCPSCGAVVPGAYARCPVCGTSSR